MPVFHRSLAFLFSSVLAVLPLHLMAETGPKMAVEVTGLPVAGGDTVSFDPAPVQSESYRTFTVRNQGDADLVLQDAPTYATLSGANGAEYFIRQSPTSTTIAPGGSATFVISFPDRQYGLKTATLKFNSNDLASTPFVLFLTGTGADLVTAAPTVTSPIEDEGTNSPLRLKYALPEPALPGSTKLLFDGIGATTGHFEVPIPGPVPNYFPYSFLHPDYIPVDFAAAGVPDGTYNMTLSYQDAAGNAAATVMVRNIQLSATAPIIGGNFSQRILFTGAPIPDFAAAANAPAGTVVRQTPDPGTLAGPHENPANHEGTYFPGYIVDSVTLIATAANGHQRLYVVPLDVRPRAASFIYSLGQYEYAPGQGGPSGLPAQVGLKQFGIPAIDEIGTVAFRAQWAKQPLSGWGIFTLDACVAYEGGSVSGIEGATYKTFSEPVLGDGHVGFIATLAGVPSAQKSALVAGPPKAAVVLAQTGKPAPGSDALPLAGAITFTAFKQMAVEGANVAFLAEIAGGAGSTKVKETTDTGLWLQDATHSLTLVLREGQSVGGKTIKSLISFRSGDHAPGQGRGWLTLSPTEGPRVLALVTFTGAKSGQAVLSAGFGGVTVVSETGAGSTGAPAQTGAAFASYGVPAMNQGSHSTFLATLSGVPATRRHGLFADGGTGSYTAIALENQPAGDTGALFSHLTDPALAADGSLAFLATLKRGVHGDATRTLWWKKPGGDLTLLAQGGQDALSPDEHLPSGTHFASFKALALTASRGPIFKAYLEQGRGHVTVDTSASLWGTDFTGRPHLVIRNGPLSPGPGQPVLKYFGVIDATPGSLGVTRAFNEAGQLVWRGTLDTGAQFIAISVIP